MVVKMVSGFDERGKVIEDLDQAVLIIEAKFDEEGNLIEETFLRKEGYPDVMPVDKAG